MSLSVNEEYRKVLACYEQCQRILTSLIDGMRRRPFFRGALREDLQTMLDQVDRERIRFGSVLEAYLKEYEAFYSGRSPDASGLSRLADALEEAERSTVVLSAGWIRKLSQLMAAFPQADPGGRLLQASEGFSLLGRSADALIGAGTDRGERRPLPREEDRDPGSPRPDRIRFSAVAPKEFTPGQYMVLNIIAYEERFRHIVDEIVRDYDEKTQEARAGAVKVQEGSSLRIVLDSPDYEAEDNEEEGIWNGDYLNFSFVLDLPEDYPKSQVLYIARVYINEVLSAKLKFVIRKSAGKTQEPDIEREDFTSAFVSYASEDRKRVAGIIQGMKKARPDMDIFFDVESIRSGADWQAVLYEEIRKRDVLYLCWSRYARESRWVDEEWRYALKQHGPDHIDIVPLDQPELCAPPEELKSKNFNERLLYIINAGQIK